MASPIDWNRAGYLSRAIMLTLIGCFGAQAGATPTSKTYDFTSYSVDVPEGADWGVDVVDKEAEMVGFRTVTYAATAGTVTASTAIAVSKVRVPPEAWALKEEQQANNFRDRRVEAMAREGSQKGFALKNVRKSVETIGGKQLYLLQYEGEGIGSAGGKGFASTLCLYFPPDYARRRAFFLFLLNTSSVKSSTQPASADRKFLEQFVGSFRLKPLPE